MSEGLKTVFEIKRSTCDCESVISSFKVNASLITLLQACECKAEGTVLRFSSLQAHVVSKLQKWNFERKKKEEKI
jgi:hypothetical protein